ncbi:MAG TPA: LLM class flavin-dependent oxidoreductase [Candidatus Dormibacteraeota bacterium]|nr:LLM class flavin-dependent oxidoreductase [Candidatus Dormibacteraeota bacterium]
MRFGLSLCPEVHRNAETREQAFAAEELGYDSVWLPEHHLMRGYAPSPLLALASLASITKRVSLGTNVVLVPFYSPVRLAEDAAVLADLSGDRFILGAGLGYRREEFAAFGVPYGERGRRMTEYLTVIRRLLGSEHVSYSGRYVELRDVTIHPRPSQPVPIWIGGWDERALRRAAALGDAWFPGPTATLERVRDCLRTYDRERAGLGRARTELPLFREVWVAAGPGDLAAGTKALSHMYTDDYVAWRHGNVELQGEEQVDAQLARDRFIVGSPDEVAEGVLRCARLGVTHLVARMHFHGVDNEPVLRSMRLFAEEVMPRVRAGMRLSA